LPTAIAHRPLPSPIAHCIVMPCPATQQQRKECCSLRPAATGLDWARSGAANDALGIQTSAVHTVLLHPAIILPRQVSRLAESENLRRRKACSQRPRILAPMDHGGRWTHRRESLPYRVPEGAAPTLERLQKPFPFPSPRLSTLDTRHLTGLVTRRWKVIRASRQHLCCGSKSPAPARQDQPIVLRV
jgi:hypothetical protein